MKIISSPSSMSLWRKNLGEKKSLGFVPTMGALHEGHISLIEKSLKENDLTAVSIFVNPIQFGPKEDFKQYPRPFRKDVSLLKKFNVDLLFSPSVSAMYPEGATTLVSVPSLNHQLCGQPQFRGHSHFDGVATVVSKLFHLTRPTRAYFGMKDFQQLRVLEQMNEDLNFGIKIVRCPTLREEDGLAKSSRNAYLSVQERALAPLFYSALQQGRKLLTSRTVSPTRVCQKVKQLLASIPNSKVEYVELVDPLTLETLQTKKGPALLAAAIRLGKTRLIDNLLIQ